MLPTEYLRDTRAFQARAGRTVSWRAGRNCWPGPKAMRGRSSDEGGVASRFRPPAEPDHGPGTCQLRGSKGSRRASLVAAWAARAAPVVGGQE